MKRFARVFGPTLLLLCLVDLSNLLLQGINNASWSQWLFLAGELLGGMVITRYGYKALNPAVSP
jgi:hypothetical protein